MAERGRKSAPAWVIALALLPLLSLVFTRARQAPGGPSKTRVALATIRSAMTALEEYRGDVGRYPQDLLVLGRRPEEGGGPRGPYLDFGLDASHRAVLDPWGHALRYQIFGEGYRLWSCGPDGLNNGGHPDSDDLVSWRP